MAKTDNLTDFLTSLADKIREHTGDTGTINPQDFESKIDSIASSSGGGGSNEGWEVTPLGVWRPDELLVCDLDLLYIFHSYSGTTIYAIAVNGKFLYLNNLFNQDNGNKLSINKIADGVYNFSYTAGRLGTAQPLRPYSFTIPSTT